jgi:integrase
MGHAAFAGCCHDFAQSKGSALVELGRGVIGALIKYVNAVHGLELRSPFVKLAAAGLMPAHSKPRARRLQIEELPAWKVAVDQLGERQRDFLNLTLYTGLRRNECRELQRQQIDLAGGVLSVPDTKNGKPHSLPITPMMRVILERRCLGLKPEDQLFKVVSAEHVHSMAMRLGAPRFMLHDLRKLVATVGEKLGLGDAVLRRILNHTAPKSDVLHRHYVGLNEADVAGALVKIQEALVGLMKDTHSTN